MVDLEKTKESLLVHLAEIMILIKATGVPLSFEINTLTTTQIKDENYVWRFAKKLPKSGSHMYYFEVDNSK